MVITLNVHKDGSITDVPVVGASSMDAFNTAAFGALTASNPTQPLPPEYPDEKVFFTITFFYNERRRNDPIAAARPPDPAVRSSSSTSSSACVGNPLVVAILGPTATGKSALALALAERFGGEIVNCDSTAVYRGFDIGTDKIAVADRRGIPHHLIDIAEPTDDYTAAQYARDAAAAIRDIQARGRLPILVGGTGFYYRALTRGLFPGPGRDAALRARLESIAERRDVHVPASAARARSIPNRPAGFSRAT